MGLILSIDIGTSGTKALLLDQDLSPVGPVVSQDTPLIRDQRGRAEHDPLVLRQTIFNVCRKTIGERAKDVSLLVVTSYQFGLLFADAEGRPLTNISTFVDTRAQSHHATFCAAIDTAEVYRSTGCPPIFQYPTNRMHFFSTHKSFDIRAVRHVWDSKAYIMHTFTGRSLTDHSTANSLGCLDLNGAWNRKLIESVGFHVEQFPQVVDGASHRVPLLPSVCRELGLNEGVEISVGLYDGAALAAALTGFQDGLAVGNFGTSGMFRVPMRLPVEDAEVELIQSCMLRPELFFNGAGINNGTSASNWFLREILKQPVSYLRNRDLSEPGARGVICFPYLSGERDPSIGTLGVGTFLGIRETTKDLDMGRAVLEGVAFSFLLIKQRLDPKNTISELRIGGGGTANTLWMSILANVLNLPVRISSEPEMGILGAASLALSGGDSGALRARSERIMTGTTCIEPDPALVPLYSEIAGRYLAMRAKLLPVLRAYHGQLM
jgi:gluconokinase